MMFKNFRLYLLNMPMGMAIGSVFVFVLGYIFDAEFSSGVEKYYTYLASVIVSLFVASFAVAGVFANIAAQDAREEEARSRKLLAVRSKLPLALSSFMKVCRSGIRFSAIIGGVPGDSSQEFINESISETTLPDHVVETFIEVIEYHDERRMAERVSGLLREYQVFKARWDDMFEQDEARVNVSEKDARLRTVSWAYLGEIAETLFNYARGDGALEDVTEKSIESHMRIRLPSNRPIEDFSEEIGLYARTYRRRFEGG